MNAWELLKFTNKMSVSKGSMQNVSCEIRKKLASKTDANGRAFKPKRDEAKGSECNKTRKPIVQKVSRKTNKLVKARGHRFRVMVNNAKYGCCWCPVGR